MRYNQRTFPPSLNWTSIHRAVFRSLRSRVTNRVVYYPAGIESLVGRRLWYSALAVIVIPFLIATLSVVRGLEDNSSPAGLVLVFLVAFLVATFLGAVMALTLPSGELTGKNIGPWNLSRLFLLYFPVGSVIWSATVELRVASEIRNFQFSWIEFATKGFSILSGFYVFGVFGLLIVIVSNKRASPF